MEITITEDQVTEWLRRNPEFLARHGELLPPPPSTNVIALGAGRLDVLSRQNGDLREQLGRMEEVVRRNEEIYRAMHGVKLAMVATVDWVDLVTTVTEALERTFAIDRVTIAIQGDAPIWEGRVPTIPEVVVQRLFLLDRQRVVRTFGNKLRTVIRIGLEGQHDRALFFGDWSGSIRSEALVPLRIGQEVIGSLNLGSAAPTRFLPSQSTDLVRDLADILTLCLLNTALNP